MINRIYTNNLFHFEQTSPCGGFVDAYVKKDSNLGKKLADNKRKRAEKIITRCKEMGMEIQDGYFWHINHPSVMVNGSEYIFYDHATFGLWDVTPETIKKTCKRFVKFIEEM